MCKLVLHCASIFYLHSLKRVTSSFNIVPLGKSRYHPPPSKCTWKRDNYCSFHNNLFPSVHIYHHLENANIFFVGTNINFTYMYTVWSKICIDSSCTSHLWLHQIVDLAFTLLDISTMNVVLKTLPSQREMYSLMVGQFVILSKINQSVSHLPFIDKFSNLPSGCSFQLCTTTSIKSLVTKINPCDPIVWFSQNLYKTSFKLKLTYPKPLHTYHQNVLCAIHVSNHLVPIMSIGNLATCFVSLSEF